MALKYLKFPIYSLAFIISGNIYGQVVDITAQNASNMSNTTQMQESSEITDTRKIIETKKSELVNKLKELKVQDFKNYSEEIQLIREETVNYIENKKKECIGEFASIIINDIGENELVKRKLTKEERKICLHDLKTFNAFYISRIIDSKKEFLKIAYDKQLINMEKAKDQLLDQLELKYKQIELQLSTTKRVGKGSQKEE